ncbi:probable dolichyl-diphosphooligosaccharide--protein glycosyltransferase subunit 3B [Physcomitrium patens]|uniref:Dolichyl-diphosphooligosaccharide--protein glycosyltransferase subunit 3B n=1 Tax=Physcomitrium patens TaxID=3218 RepID=A0A2K1KUC5_PHYPA|nr:probable dolichyl-diphosphooligosaccharide--protein glycosyltransferase subunit 3B isoform X1 [Physcomitrium patens]PNR57395.1 hypothetical protein PHYPA_004389 [Physcomitrium patens]|eukprot:XP_024371518.1 probable dolichyl-diphosphooligosaccharide--protein glycosyltransferase subunit 3B isoform X1 [Physcomitrella patens]
MWRSRCLGVGFLLVVMLLVSEADLNEDRVAELKHLRSQSKDGVIRLEESNFRRFMATTKPRPYSLILFFDASQLHANTELKLVELRKEFGLVATAYAKHNEGTDADAKVFFCDLEFKKMQGVFQLFGVQALPHIRSVAPGSEDQKVSEEMNPGEFPRTAEGIASFVTAKTKEECGPIERPLPLSKGQIWALCILILLASPFLLKFVTSPNSPLREPRLWCLGALMIYFFSVSGGMHNIIRKMPLFMQDHNNQGKLVFFYQGSGMQLGAEGFVVGFLYTLVGVLLAIVTHFAPLVRSKTVQRLVMFLVITVSFVAVRKVISLDNWKTGYWIYAFWPSRWM